MRFTENIILNLSSFSASTLYTSSAIDLSNIVAFAVQFIWTGSLTGSVYLNASCDGINWILLANSTGTPAGSAGTFLVNYFEAGFRYFQAVYSNTSGSGTLQAVYNGKGV